MLVSAKVQMIKRRFELKISDVLFLGYMNKLVRKMDKMDVCFNVLFALQVPGGVEMGGGGGKGEREGVEMKGGWWK